MNYYDEEDWKLDNILLIARRIFIIALIWAIIWIILFKLLWWSEKKDKLENIENEGTVKTIWEDIWRNYIKNKDGIWYKWERVLWVNAEDFEVINQNGKYSAMGKIINSKNLLEVFADYDTRVLLMRYIDQIIKNEKNVTSELKSSSENGMYNMKTDYDDLEKFNWNDRYNMTNEQRAKFALMFIYLKTAKSMSNNEASMETALKELKYFLENFDKKDLEKELSQKDMKEIKWDIWLDKHCIYVDGKLYACFLDEIFVISED